MLGHMPKHADIEQALTGAIAEAAARATEAAAVAHTTTAMAAAVLNGHGYSDRSIASVLNVSRNRIRDLINSATPNRHQGWAREWIDEIWAQAQQSASPWQLDDTLHFSCNIMESNEIPMIPNAHLTELSTLDTTGAQFINRATGDKLLVYSRQRWEGSPIEGAAPVTWDHRGWYVIERRDADGTSTPFDPQTDLGLPDGAQYFGRGWKKGHRVRRDGDAFDAIIRAIQQKYSILPPATEVRMSLSFSANG